MIINLDPVEGMTDTDRTRAAREAMEQVFEHFDVELIHEGSEDIEMWIEVIHRGSMH